MDLRIKKEEVILNTGNINYGEEPKTRKDSLNMDQLRKAIKLSKNLVFLKKIRKLSLLFTKERMKKIFMNTSQRFFTDREKLVALSLYKKGPQVYRLLSKIFVIPPTCELYKLSSKLNIELGLNERIRAKLKRRALEMERLENMCVLLFDEVNIGPTVIHEQRSGKVPCNETNRRQIADHAIIFMIRLIFKEKNQPVAYKFSAGKVTEDELAIYIEHIITDLQSCGMKVVSTVCDHDARNVGAINILVNESSKKYPDQPRNSIGRSYEVNRENIIPLYDVTQLLKGIRNDLMTKDLKFFAHDDILVAKWVHIILLQKYRLNLPEQIASDLTRRHVDPVKLDLVDPKYAVQLFSDRNIRALGFWAFEPSVPVDCVDTAHAMLIFERLYKSMSGKNIGYKVADPMLRLVCTKRFKTVHQRLWLFCKEVLVTMTFLEDDKEVHTLSLECWLHTINNAMYVTYQLFMVHNIRAFWMGRFKMDPLMDFIKRLQRYGCENITTYKLV